MEIYTYGSGEFIAGVLEAVKSLTSGGVVMGMIKILLITSLLGGLVTATIGQLLGGARGGMYESAMKGAVEVSPILLVIRTGILAAVAVYFLLNPFIVTDVIVEDKYDPSQSKVVTAVPMGIAFIGHSTSVIGDKMGEVIEELITPVEAVRFRTGGGVAIGPKYLNNLFDIMPPGAPSEYGSSGNVPTRGVAESWFSECIYYQLGLIQGESTRAEGLTALAKTEFILTEPSLQQPPFIDPNTPLRVQYYAYPAANETTCNNATQQILAAWYNPAVFNKWVERFSARQFGTREDDPTVLPRVYDLVDRYFPNSFLGTQDKLVQLAMINSAYAAYVKFAAENSDVGSADIAKRKQGGAWVEMARMGTKSLFVMRQVAEACLYLFGAFLPVFMAATGFGALFKYIKFAFWLQLWIPIFVIFNAISDYNLFKAIESVSACTGGSCSLSLNFETVDKLRTETSQIIGYIGLMAMSVPGLAWGLMKGAESLGGMASSAVQSHQAGSVGGKAVSERTSALTHFTAGTMAGSAAAAGIGQMRIMSDMSAVNSHGGLGAYGESVGAAMGREMTVGTWQNRAITDTGLQMGEGLVGTAASANFADAAGRGIGRDDAAKFAAQAGYMPAGSGVFDLSRMENRRADVITSNGVTSMSFDAGGGIPVGSFKKTGLTYTGADGQTKTLIGAEGQFIGDKFTVRGIDPQTNQAVTLEGMSKDIDLAAGRVNGYGVVSGKGESGMNYWRTMSVDQALQEYKDLKGTKFYQGLSALDKNKAVFITENRDAQTGALADISAVQGSKSLNTDRDDRIKLSNFHSGTRKIKENTNLNISQQGTQSWSGFRKIEEYSNTKMGVFKDIDPETGKQADYYGRWHYNKQGKLVAADFTNLQTGRLSTVRTDKDGVKHYGVGTYQSGRNGVGMVSDFRETSSADIANQGYHTRQVLGPAGNVLIQRDMQGQDTSVLHRFTEDRSKQFITSIGDSVFIGDSNADMTQMKGWQKEIIKGFGLVGKTADYFGNIVGTITNVQYLRGFGKEGTKLGTVLWGGKPSAPNNTQTTNPPRPPLRERPLDTTR